MNTSEILDRAADLLQINGWTTGTEGWFIESNHGLCIEGALSAAVGVVNQVSTDEILTCPAFVAVRKYLGLTDDVPLYMWNDQSGHCEKAPDEPARTASEVIEVLRACALIEASRERAAVQA